MLDEYQKHIPKPTSKAELKVVLQTIWDKTCHKPPLTEQYWRSERDCRHALHLKADTLNTSFASSQNGSFQSHDSFRVTNRFFSELTTIRGQEKQKLNCSCIIGCMHVKLKLEGSVA